MTNRAQVVLPLPDSPTSATVRPGYSADPFDPALSDVALVRVPPRVGRITAQQGLFSLHADPTKEWDPGTGYPYETLEIPAAAKPYFRQVLNAFGVNRGRLMIDLDGLCATLAWNYRTRT